MDNRGNITFADEYQDFATETEIFTHASELFLEGIATNPVNDEAMRARNWLRLSYCAGKLNGEAGEIAEQVFKAFRDDGGTITEARQDALLKELGDALWYISQLARLLDFRLSDVMTANIQKLFDRKDRGVLGGSGDDR